MDVLELLRGQFVHFHQHLEVVPWKIRDLVDGERQLNLKRTNNNRQRKVIKMNDKGGGSRFKEKKKKKQIIKQI